MKELKFKTNINCNGCKTSVTPFLDKEKGICHWSVDLDNEDKVLTVQSDGITSSEVSELLQKAGYNSDYIEN